MMAPLAELIRREDAKPAPAQTKTICAWCAPKREAGSHGICPACRERLLTQS